MKWADGEARRLGINNVDISQTNKLLITNIPDTCDESQLLAYLKPYGEIRILKLVKGTSGSMGNRCYVKFTTKEQAILAVKELNQSVVLPGGTKPIEINFAEQLRTTKKKEIVHKPVEYRPVAEIEVTKPKDIYYEFKTQDNRSYFFSMKDNKTQWERPNENDAVIYPEEEYYKLMNSGQQENDDEDTIKLLIRNLPASWDEASLKEFVKTHGEFDAASIVDNDYLKSVGKEESEGKTGLIELKDASMAQNLVNNINGHEIEGNTLKMDVL